MSFWGEKGVEVILPSDKIENLIGEGSGLIVVEVNKDKEIKYLDFIEKYGLKTQKIGAVKEEEFIVEPFIKRNISEFLRRR